MLTAAIIVFGILLVLAFFYNKLVNKKNQVENALGSIDVMQKKRYDLIPNLIETVKSYMSYERETLNKIIVLRTRAMAGHVSDEEKTVLDKELSANMDKIILSVENYPELRAGEHFLQLQSAWNETEESISASRRFYNTAVTEYNNAIEQFPTNIFARSMNYNRKSVFEITETERQNLNARALFNS